MTSETRREITCILCPNGCELVVSLRGEPTAENLVVEGNLCPRGLDYALEEITAPTRTLTTSVRVRRGTQPQTSIKTACPIPREALLAARAELRGVTLDAPVSIGDIVRKDVAGTGADVVVTRPVAEAG